MTIGSPGNSSSRGTLGIEEPKKLRALVCWQMTFRAADADRTIILISGSLDKHTKEAETNRKKHA